MADGSYRLLCSKEFLDNLDDTRVQADIFRCASAGDEKTGIVSRVNSIEISCQGEIVARLLRIGLITEEIVNCSSDRLAGLLVRADSINLIAKHGK